MSLLRAFIALDIPPEIIQSISTVTASLRKETGHTVRWVAPENIHLTLKFLGEVSPANLEHLSARLAAECEHHPPFDISVKNLGCFPNLRQPRVIWAGLIIPPQLLRLQSQIESAAARLGYAAETRPFSPHLTIGRVREQAGAAELQTLRSLLEKAASGDFGTFTARAVHLYKSDLNPGGPVYTRLNSAPLR